MFRMGSYLFFPPWLRQDAKDSTHVIAGMDQGGLGLPDRDYYLKTDESQWICGINTWSTCRRYLDC
jgi:predicted metalloendopeptidase